MFSRAYRFANYAHACGVTVYTVFVWVYERGVYAARVCVRVITIMFVRRLSESEMSVSYKTSCARVPE